MNIGDVIAKCVLRAASVLLGSQEVRDVLFFRYHIMFWLPTVT